MGTPKNTSFLGVIYVITHIYRGLLKKTSIFPWVLGVLTSTPPFGPSPKDAALPVFFAGDALREPFWPMGEGCSRGFMGAFDTVWTVRCGVPRDGEQLPKAVRWSSETSWLLLVKRVVWFESGPPVYWCFSMVFLACILTMFNFRHISPTLHHYLNCMDFLLAVFKT